MTHVYNKYQRLREVSGNENIVTLPQYFKLQGYRTMSFGPVFHFEAPETESWSEIPFMSCGYISNDE